MATVVVTGAAGALGRAVCNNLIQGRYDVIGIDAGKFSPDIGFDCISDVDLTCPLQVSNAFDRISAEKGQLGGLVNIAGGFIWREVTAQEFSDWEAMFRVNLQTAVLSSQRAIPLLEDGAAIVNVGAAAASGRVEAGMGSYAASKAGVMAFTQSLADELRPRRIRVNAILPTILDTETNRREMPDADQSCWVSPVDAARVVSFLLSQESRSITGEGIRLSLGPLQVS